MGKHRPPGQVEADVWVLDDFSVGTGNPEHWVPRVKAMVDKYNPTQLGA